MQAETKLFDLSGLTVLLTGATGHLGRALAHGLAEAGARLVVSSRTMAAAKSVADELPSPSGARHVAAQIDHLDQDSLQNGFERAVAEVGTLDVLIANGHQPTASDWKSVTDDEFNQQMRNATGYFMLARLLREHVVSRSASGNVIFLGSMYGLVGSYPDAYAGIGPASPVAYHALKGGIIHMTRHLAVYWAADKVRVNCLSPGPFPAPTVADELVSNLSQHSPMGRMGRAEELVGPAVFLASNASSYVTGHNLVVDGGWTAW
ncbi:Gluconate 5-dehydrogenase [Novipirellula galeiformis]|uniref:Gluconate 5-dehydrogenase n=1 Tax=Novipirellula galeiformis TaxID=2528004 RepID=A0A5C6CQQ2_9BACT|nr:SDR family oxidoreductase [Novipirellula galeiformis]TWU25426.1 Gluconate 5-dehydrogenase [Novipirellula galeiformis]